MPVLLRAANPATLELSHQSRQLSPCSPFRRHGTFGVALADAGNSQAGKATPFNHLPPIAIYPFKKTRPVTADTQQLPFLTQPPPVSDISGNSTANPDTLPKFTSYCFPVFGPFDLLYCIQKGGFAVAWAARDQSTGRLLCLKVYQSLLNPDVKGCVRAELKMFRRMVKSREGERGRQFLIELNRSIQHRTTVFFAMELMSVDLATYLFNEPERCRMDTRRWMAQIALGIESLHEMGIIHRDIKTENILVDSRENIRIIDFGLSYLNPAGEALCRGVGYATDFLGTPPYMAPEVLRNKRMPSHRKRCYGTAIDWWALGCVLFELEAQDHQPLFDTEEDVHAYVAWTQRPSQLEQAYSKFEGLEPVARNLLEGLLEVRPSLRYCMDDLERHEYFQHQDGCEFHDAAARALARPVRPELVPQDTGARGPIGVIEAAKLSSMYDWTNLKWAFPLHD